MKPDEAIEILKNMKWSITTKFNAVNSSTKALDMAISALEKQEKKPARAKFNKRYNKFVYFCPVCCVR